MKYFPIYVDLLGYEKRAIDDSKKIDLNDRDLRYSYVNIIEIRLNKLKARRIIEFYNKSSDSDYSDEKLVYTNNIHKALITVGELLKTKLPLSIAIGVIEVNDEYLIERSTETISFLKTYIIPKYKKYCKDECRQQLLNETFILLTIGAYNELDSKRICSKPHESAEFYLIEQKYLKMELKSLEFIEKIGSQRREYKAIEELFVPPSNYEEIKIKLENNNIIFIVGDAEIGKTYTAMMLLREYFNKGYEPIYFSEERRIEQWKFIRHDTNFDGKTIYLEDPWGKVEFENLESILKDIGSFITEVKNKNCKIILTSREKVFKEFESKKEISEDLWKYVIHLKINTAYDKEQLGKIMDKYITFFEPSWSNNRRLSF